MKYKIKNKWENGCKIQLINYLLVYDLKLSSIWHYVCYKQVYNHIRVTVLIDYYLLVVCVYI